MAIGALEFFFAQIFLSDPTR